MDNMDEISIGVPFTKVDPQKRTVIGIATADNVDLAGDVVDPEATAAAFSKWMGNIREMHKPEAVGKAVSFRPIEVPHNGRMYKGMELEVYVSRGAQDTWEKVLDGTLRGFSIGGKINQAEKKFVKDVGRDVRVVKSYDLQEVSLVDNPCNPASMISLVKMADGAPQYELDLKKYTINYCAEDNEVVIDQEVCTKGHTCHAIGQVDELDLDIITKMISNSREDSESNTTPSNTESNSAVTKTIDSAEGENKLQDNTNNASVDNVSDLPQKELGTIRKFLNWIASGEAEFETVEKAAPSTSPTIIINTGEIAKSTPEVKDEVLEKACSHDNMEKGDKTCPDCGDEIAKSDDGDEDDSVKKSDEVISEQEGEDTMDLEKMLEGIGSLLDEKLAKVKDEVTAEVTATVDEKIDALQKSVDEKVEGVEERVETVESSGAMKKSADAEEDAEDAELSKSANEGPFWGGIFVPTELAKVLGYDS